MKLENLFSISINNERYNYQCKVFQHYGLPTPKKFDGLKYEPSTETSCLFSHISLLMMCRHLKLPYYIAFEDDAYPRKDILIKLDYYMNNAPRDCGILILGRNGQFGSTEEHGDYYIIKERPFGAHAYIVYQNIYDKLLYSFEKTRVADLALKGNNYLDYPFKPYWTKELLFIQNNIDNTTCMSKNLAKKGRYFYPNKKSTVNSCYGNLDSHEDLPDNINWEQLDF